MRFSIREILFAARRRAAWLCLRPVRLLVVAGIFHLALTLALYAVTRKGLLPGTFDANGIAVAYAPDGLRHRQDAAALSEVLRRVEIREWVAAPYLFHIKLYSVCFAFLGPWLGFNIIGAEPLNLLCYLAILALVFNLGREAFNARVGFLAAGTIALWPSFLLHTTQLLRDPLFAVAMLAFVLVILRWLTRTFSWTGALFAGAGGGLLAVVLWLTRDSAGVIVFATVLLGAGMLIARQFIERRAQITNLTGMALLIALTVGVQLTIPKFYDRRNTPITERSTVGPETSSPLGTGAAAQASYAESPAAVPWSRLATRVMAARNRFIKLYPNSGSNIDGDVQLNNTADLVRYFPRAAVIGFFAPFPDMWLAPGKQVGFFARLLAGSETLVMYGVEALALFGLWRDRRRLPAWFLLSVAATGIIALGFVVVNAGALFRLRYVFLMLVVILGASGAEHILQRLAQDKERRRQPVEA
jgi:hypothetical protein